MMSVVLWGAGVRMVQALMDCIPTFAVGLLVAALFERILGRQGTFRLFGAGTWRQLPFAWLLGMLIPVCSLGAIPVMTQMRKSGISGGTVLAFGLTAPLFNPISVLYGLANSDPMSLFIFCIGSLTIVSLIGLAWDWAFPSHSIEIEALPTTPYGLKRIGVVVLSFCHNACSSSLLYAGVAVLGVGGLAVALPAGVLQHAASPDDWLAPLTMAGVASIAYITPMVAIVQVSSMFEHGNSVGAAFTLLALGTGMNVGTVLWSMANYGIKKTVSWALLLLSIVLLISYGIDRPLRPSGIMPADHTHAFDQYCNPFIEGGDGIEQTAARLVRESTSMDEFLSAVSLSVLIGFGGFLRLIDPSGKLINRLLVPQFSSAGKFRDFVIPDSIVGAIGLCALIIASILGCYVYYPETKEIRAEMNAIQAEIYGAVSERNWKALEFLIPRQEDWAHKLVISRAIRGQTWSRFQNARFSVYIQKLEMLEHASEDGSIEQAVEWNKQAASALNRLKDTLN